MLKRSPPNSEKRLMELKNELEYQKQRFVQSAFESGEQIRENLAVLNWVKQEPIQAAVAFFLGGLIAAQILYRQK